MHWLHLSTLLGSSTSWSTLEAPNTPEASLSVPPRSADPTTLHSQRNDNEGGSSGVKGMSTRSSWGGEGGFERCVTGEHLWEDERKWEMGRRSTKVMKAGSKGGRGGGMGEGEELVTSQPFHSASSSMTDAKCLHVSWTDVSCAESRCLKMYRQQTSACRS